MTLVDSPDTRVRPVDPHAGDAGRASVSFVCEPGRLEAQAVLLAASLRAAHGELSLVAAVPRALCEDTRQALDSLGVVQTPIENPLSHDYPIGNKIAALGAGDAAGLRVFLDSDMLCLRPLDWRVLGACELSAKPADVTSFGSEALWDCLYQRFSLAPPAARVAATYSGQLMYPYFNAGMIATTQAATLAPLWAQVCRQVDAMDDVNPRRPWLDQIGLPLAAARLGLAARSLGDDWNYPAHIKPLLGEPCLVHYHVPQAVAREAALVAHVDRLLSRFPQVAVVVRRDETWMPVLRAIERRRAQRPPARRWSLRGAWSAAGQRPASRHDLIVTGIPRSGTSYVCRRLDSLANTAVVNEPASLFETLRYGPEPWAVPLLYADLRTRIDAGEPVQNKLDARGELTEDTAAHETLANYRPRLRDADWVLATKNTLAYMARLDGLLRVMPEVRVVMCVRHPADTLASWKGTFAHLASGDPRPLPVGGLADPYLPAHLRAGLEQVAALTHPAWRRAAWWRLLAEEALRWRDHPRVLLLRYEDLVADPAVQVARLLGPLAARAGQPEQPMERSATRTHRRQTLDAEDGRALEALCIGAAGALGYDSTLPAMRAHA